MLRTRVRRGQGSEDSILLPNAEEIVKRLKQVIKESELFPLCILIAALAGKETFTAPGIARMFDRTIRKFLKAGFAVDARKETLDELVSLWIHYLLRLDRPSPSLIETSIGLEAINIYYKGGGIPLAPVTV